MKRIFLLGVAVLVLLPASASAITDGELDGNRHPYVGLMVAHDATGAPLWRCSGTLISSRLFLTAGHCTEAPAAHVEIWFSAGPIPSGNYPGVGPCGSSVGYPCKGDVGGTPYTHPSYNPNAFYLFDLGVVQLTGTPPVTTYGVLPGLNQLDTLRSGQKPTFTSVGYGLQNANKNHTEAIRVRMLARPRLIGINSGYTGDYSILLSNNSNTGGTCFGDSGGPNFIGDSNVIAGVTSYGKNKNCAGTGGVYRVDRADDLNWLRTFPR